MADQLAQVTVPILATNTIKPVPDEKSDVVSAIETPSAAAQRNYVQDYIETPYVSGSEHSKLEALRDHSMPPKSIPHRMTIENLPNELLSQIFKFLDSPPLSADLQDEPTFELTNADITNLKASSYVSKRWRESVLPLLFKHSRIVFANLQLKSPGHNPRDELQPFLNFVKEHDLSRVITTFVIVAKGGMNVAGNDLADLKKLKLDIYSNFWRSLFDIIDPVSLLIIAHPVLLSAFTSCEISGVDAWNFDCPCHYLRLQRPTAFSNHPAINEGTLPSSNSPTATETHELSEPSTSMLTPDHVIPDLQSSQSDKQSDPDPGAEDEALNPKLPLPASMLFEVREWSSILLNEGSFVKAYSAYEFWLRTAPSILSDMLGATSESSRPLITPTIREMSYIGIFPMASHFNSLTKQLPRLDRLYVQLVPRNNILQNPSKVAHLDMQDLWMERNSCYALLMRELFNAPPIGNYKYLQIFESGDAADRDAWHMAVEYVKRAGNGWRVAGDGVFERNAEDLVPEPEEGDTDADPSLYQGALIRWAWNGTTKLPVGASRLYEDPFGPVN